MTRPLPQPFHVLATQNPIEQEGTWPLPEAQLDRFLTMIRIPTPDAKALAAITRGTTGNMPPKVEPVMTPEHLLALQQEVRQVVVATPVRDWAACLVLATHPASELAPKELVNAIECGASPRAGQALLGMAKRIGLSGRSLPHWHGGSATGCSSSLAAPIVAHVRIPSWWW